MSRALECTHFNSQRPSCLVCETGSFYSWRCRNSRQSVSVPINTYKCRNIPRAHLLLNIDDRRIQPLGRLKNRNWFLSLFFFGNLSGSSLYISAAKSGGIVDSINCCAIHLSVYLRVQGIVLYTPPWMVPRAAMKGPAPAEGLRSPCASRSLAVFATSSLTSACCVCGLTGRYSVVRALPA